MQLKTRMNPDVVTNHVYNETRNFSLSDAVAITEADWVSMGVDDSTDRLFRSSTGWPEDLQ